MNKNFQLESSRRLLLLLVILAAFAWHLQGLSTQSLWRDEVDAIYFAVRYLPETLSMFVSAGQNGALYFLALRPWFMLVGTSEFALRYPSAIFSILSLPLLWQVVRILLPTQTQQDNLYSRAWQADIRVPQQSRQNHLHDPYPNGPPLEAFQQNHANNSRTEVPRTKVSSRDVWLGIISDLPLLATLFLAINPYQLWYSQEGKMYSLVTCLALCAGWCWLRGIDSGGWRPWLAYLVAMSLAIYSHLLMILMIPLHMLWFIIAWPRSRYHIGGYLFALAGLTLPYLPMLWWQWDMLMSADRRTGFNFVPLLEMLKSLLTHHAHGFLTPQDSLWLAPLFFLGVAGLGLGLFEIQPTQRSPLSGLSAGRRFAIVISWLIVPVLSIYLLSLRQPIFTERYVIWIAPAVMMLLALGIQLVWQNAGWLGRPLTAVLLLYVLGFWSYYGWQHKIQPIKYDLRSAVTHIYQHRETTELLILQIPHMEYAYRYYSSDQGSNPLLGSDERLGHWAGGLWTNNSWDDEQAQAQVNQQMLGITANVTAVWVMRSEVEMWDRRYLMDSWLDEHGELMEQLNFHGTEVRHYLLK